MRKLLLEPVAGDVLAAEGMARIGRRADISRPAERASAHHGVIRHGDGLNVGRRVDLEKLGRRRRRLRSSHCRSFCRLSCRLDRAGIAVAVQTVIAGAVAHGLHEGIFPDVVLRNWYRAGLVEHERSRGLTVNRKSHPAGAIVGSEWPDVDYLLARRSRDRRCRRGHDGIGRITCNDRRHDLSARNEVEENLPTRRARRGCLPVRLAFRIGQRADLRGQIGVHSGDRGIRLHGAIRQQRGDLLGDSHGGERARPNALSIHRRHAKKIIDRRQGLFINCAHANGAHLTDLFQV
ncbi:hypothetical protein FGU64_04270 [Mesorhizobium sp. 8]|nr:hypothetical protein FGU64_04270 [Mesorhizobium sp. 8]